jgi:hypothetical protein
MKVSWIISDRLVLDPTVNIDELKNIGSIWGSWRTWRSSQTDNVICHDLGKADELIKRAFHAVCNFYIPKSIYEDLGRPPGIKIYEGEFVHDVEYKEEIIAMHLASMDSDLVLLLGFDFGEFEPNLDKLLEHRAHNYRSLTKQVINDNPEIQWIAIDHPSAFRKDLLNVDNLTQDTLDNALTLLAT